MITPFKTTFDLLKHAAGKYADQVAVSGTVAGKPVGYTYKQILQQATLCAKALLGKGITVNENVGIITGNRIEWCVLDAAIAMIGAVNVTLFPNYDRKDIIHIINDARIKHLFVGNKLMFQFLNAIVENIPTVKHTYSFDEIDGVISFKELLKQEESETINRELEQRTGNLSGSDIYTIFYTSGTGGTPKGVVMPHQSIVNAAVIMGNQLKLNNTDVSLGFLSCSHAYERGHYYAYLHYGVKLNYAEITKSPLENIQKYQPSVFTSVPLILQKIHDAVINITVNEPEHQQALAQAYRYEFGDETQNQNYLQYQANIYGQWKAAFGKNIRAISCAGAPLPDYIFRFVCASGIKLQEIYGLSECFMVTCGQYPDKVKFGTAGAIGDYVEVKISDDGEIIVRNATMMKGFYNLPEYTKEVLDDEGWFKTGDKGEIADGIFLKLTGRKKDIFKIASGMYIAPSEIENIINASPFVINSLVFEKKGKIAILIVPDKQTIIAANPHTQHAAIGTIKLIIKAEVDRLYNNTAMPAEQIEEITIDEDLWSVDGGQLTPTMKVKREVILKNKNLI